MLNMVNDQVNDDGDLEPAVLLLVCMRTCGLSLSFDLSFLLVMDPMFVQFPDAFRLVVTCLEYSYAPCDNYLPNFALSLLLDVFLISSEGIQVMVAIE